MAVNKSQSDAKYGGITMPTKPSTGRIRKQTHSKRQPAEGYNSNDDAKATGYEGSTPRKTNHSHMNFNTLKGRVD